MEKINKLEKTLRAIVLSGIISTGMIAAGTKNMDYVNVALGSTAVATIAGIYVANKMYKVK